MKTDLSLVALGMAASLFVSACGSSSGGSCGNSAACGGNIVGTWKITSSCLSANAAMVGGMDCPTATISSSKLTVTGTATYNADMTYSHASSVSGTATVVLPSSCLMSQGITVSCDQLNQVFAANPQPGISVHCTGSSSCTCTEMLSNADASESGTYTITAAGSLTETPANGDPTVSDYCVTGTTLTESPDTGGTVTFSKS